VRAVTEPPDSMIEAAGGNAVAYGIRRARECGRHDAIIILRYEEPECELRLDRVVCVTDAGGGDPGLRT
jgi:hypothetical protein